MNLKEQTVISSRKVKRIPNEVLLILGISNARYRRYQKRSGPITVSDVRSDVTIGAYPIHLARKRNEAGSI